VYRPQLGVGGGVLSGGQPSQLSGNGPINERDDRGRLQGGGYSEANSPLSPSAGSDFSFSRYNSNDTYPPQRNLAYPNNEPPMPNSRSNNSLISQRSSGSNSTHRDSVVVEHYAALKKYLTRHLAAEGIADGITDDTNVAGLNQRQNKAREKLIRLSKQQFNELSTDVYDELMRRQNTSSSIPEDRMSLTPANQPFLVPKENFHPKRNQARQKLATLPPGRFKELASDVLYEIERRYPVSVEAANNNQYLSTEENMQRTTSASSFGSQRSDQSYSTPYSSTRSDGLPNSTSRDRFPSSISSNNLATPSIPEEAPEEGAIQRTGMQNTIIPNKSTMIEEDGPEDSPEDDVDTLQRSPSKSTPVQKSLQSNTIVPNTSTMVEESTDEEDPADDDRRIASTIAPSITASSKSLSPPIFKSNAFANANINGLKNRSVSPPPMLPKSRSQLEAEERKEREMQEKLEEYEDKIEALKERIAELQQDLKSTKEELRIERAKSPPPPPAGNDRRLQELETENDRLKEELREQQEVYRLMIWLTVGDE
jgi:Spa2 homology domain (SHD) of GIT